MKDKMASSKMSFTVLVLSIQDFFLIFKTMHCWVAKLVPMKTTQKMGNFMLFSTSECFLLNQCLTTLLSLLSLPQVSNLLTNHLSRAMDRLVVSESGASEGLQDALSLLLGLAKSQLGRAILSQPGCISKLLLLLTDQR